MAFAHLLAAALRCSPGHALVQDRRVSHWRTRRRRQGTA